MNVISLQESSDRSINVPRFKKINQKFYYSESNKFCTYKEDSKL